MNHSVFYQRLDTEPWDQESQNFRRSRRDGVFQLASIADLLDVQISVDVFQLLSDGDFNIIFCMKTGL